MGDDMLWGIDDEYDDDDGSDDVSQVNEIDCTKGVVATFNREIREPMHVIIEGYITESDMTYISLYHVLNEKAKCYMWIDTREPEVVLNALEEYVREGYFWNILKFIEKEGRSIRDPVELRLKLDIIFNGGTGFSNPDESLF